MVGTPIMTSFVKLHHRPLIDYSVVSQAWVGRNVDESWRDKWQANLVPRVSLLCLHCRCLFSTTMEAEKRDPGNEVDDRQINKILLNPFIIYRVPLSRRQSNMRIMLYVFSWNIIFLIWLQPYRSDSNEIKKLLCFLFCSYLWLFSSSSFYLRSWSNPFIIYQSNMRIWSNPAVIGRFTFMHYN